MTDAVLIAALGAQPQLVTLPLDLLLERGEAVREVVVLHTSLARQATRAAAALLGSEFEGRYPNVRLRLICLCDERGVPLKDVDSESASHEVFIVLYREFKAAKQAGRRVHFSIAGGRKTFAAYGMVVAQLLFEPDDRVWHIFSTPELIASRALHAPPGAASLVRMPVLRWSGVSPVLTDMAQSDDPLEAMRRWEEMQRMGEMRAAREFVTQRLSAAEREVVQLVVCEGLTDGETADRICRSVRTVGHHLSSVYRKARSHFGLSRADRHTLTSLLGIYYTLEGVEKGWDADKR